MRFRKTFIILLALFTAVFVLNSAPAVMPMTAEAAASVTAAKVIVVDSAKGATQSDIQSALNSLRSEGGIVKLVGSFTITTPLRMYSNQTIAATGAKITGKASNVIVMTDVSDITVRGGTWTIAKGSMMVKAVRCKNLSFHNFVVSGGGGKDYGCIYVHNGDTVKADLLNMKNTSNNALHFNYTSNVTVAKNSFGTIEGYAVKSFGGNNINIISNTALDVHGDGIYCGKAVRGNITGNVIKRITFNPERDIDPVRNEARSGCGMLISDSENINVGKPMTYDGTVYSGNVIRNCDNYGIHLSVNKSTYIERLTCSDTGSDGIHNSACAATTVRDSSFTNMGGLGIALEPGPVNTPPQECIACANSVVYNNTITGCKSYGIMTYRSENVRIAANTVKKSALDGIRCTESKNIRIAGNVISDTTGDKGAGIAVSNQSTVNIGSALSAGGKTYKGNIIRNVKQMGISVNESTAVISGNTISGTSDHGIRVNASPQVIVTGNTVSNVLYHGIFVTYSTKASVKSNTVVTPKQNGIFVKGSNYSSVLNNTVSYSGRHGIQLAESCFSATVQGNKVTSPKYHGIQLQSNCRSANIKSNTISSPGNYGIQFDNTCTANVKSMSAISMAAVTTKTTRVTGKVSSGSTCKIKIGSTFYNCTVSGTNFTSAIIPKQKANAVIYLYVYPGASNTVTTSTKVHAGA